MRSATELHVGPSCAPIRLIVRGVIGYFIRAFSELPGVAAPGRIRTSSG